MLTQDDLLSIGKLINSKLEIINARLAKTASKDDLRTFATKDDLRLFATKEDLKAFATKDDLKQLVTKDDLTAFARKDDLKSLATKKDAKGLRKQLKEIDDNVLGLRRLIQHDNKRINRIEKHLNLPPIAFGE